MPGNRPTHDLLGKRNNRLTVEKLQGKKGARFLWGCRCDCGKMVVVETWMFNSGHVKSCGCLYKEMSGKTNLIHGKKHTRIYKIWQNMKTRCSNKNVRCYKYYGGRGINYDERWESFIEFYKDMQHGYSDDLTLERKDNNGNYNKRNCRWATRNEQANNKSSNHKIKFNGKNLNICEWAEITGIRKSILYKRISVHGWSIERALTQKPRKRTIDRN